MTMRNTRQIISIVAVLAALLALPVLAQEAQCPRLPANSGLHWNEVRNPDLLFCNAVGADGVQAFSVMLSRESPFRPVRSLRAESSTIHGGEARWYRTEIASRPDLQARETSIELADGTVAYFNVQARSDAELQAAYSQIAALQF